MKGIRANYIAAELLNNRPDYESWEEFCRKHNLSVYTTVKSLNDKLDIQAGLLYRIAKIFGYSVIVYNPNPPKNMEKMYVLGKGKKPVMPREQKRITCIKKDKYTGEVYRVARKYKKKSKLVKVFTEKKSV